MAQQIKKCGGESVMEFAKRIGAFQVIKLGSGDALVPPVKKQRKQPAAQEQVLSYAFVIDFESTCWNDKVQRSQEIRVLLNLATGKVVDEFQSYVEPQEQPNLSAFCTDLTGIKQIDVAGAMPLRYVIRSFKAWIEKNIDEFGLRLVTPSDVVSVPDSKRLVINKGQQEPSKKWATFITWSDWDLNVCLYYECNRKQIARPPYFNCWIDLRAVYTEFYERRPLGLNGALKEVGLTFVGREHCGLDDAKNTAILAQRLVNDGCLLTVTKMRTS